MAPGAPYGCWGHRQLLVSCGCYGENMQMNGASALSVEREGEKGKDIFIKVIILSLGQTRNFFKITNELPEILWASDGCTS